MKILRNYWIYNLRLTLSLLVTCLLCVTGKAAVDYVPGRLIVKPKPTTTQASWQQLQKTCGTTLKTTLTPGDECWEVIEFDPLEDVSDKAIEYLKSGLVEYAEPDYIVHPAVIPDDPYSLNESRAYNLQKISAPVAWNYVHDATDVIVAVVDYGVRYSHEDLADNMWVNSGETPDDGIDNDRNGYIDDIYGINLGDSTLEEGDPLDTNGHGTHVAGIIGACGNNATGITGMAWNTQIMACKFMGETASLSDGIKAMIYARKNGANVINASWTISSPSTALANELSTMQRQGIFVVCAAGNESSNLDDSPLYPACYSTKYSNVICVGNSNSSDTRRSDSCYSSKYVQLFAPGTYIYSTYAFSDARYQTLSGSSMASPHVAGAIALYIQLYPSASISTIRSQLLSSVDKIDALSGFCSSGGRLNLASFLSGKSTPTVTWSTPSTITHGTALSSTQLNATASVDGTFTYSPSEGTVLDVGSHTLTATFTPTDTTTYNNSENYVTLVVDKLVPVVTWDTPEPITYGTALSSTQLNATADVEGTFVYSPEEGTILSAGESTLSVTFTPTDSTIYEEVTASVSITVTPLTLVVTWETPDAIVFGTPLSDVQLNATADVEGSFVYEPSAGTILDIGSHSLSALFTPEDTTNYESVVKWATITINTPSISVHPADTDSNYYLTETETTNYEQTWKSGSIWGIEPNPIPVSYLTRAAYLWKAGESYTGNTEQEAPLWWVSASTTEPTVAPAATCTITNSTVTITAIPGGNSYAWAIEETLPTWVEAINITGDGALDTVHQQVKWGNNFTQVETVVSYDLFVDDDIAGFLNLEGLISVNGVNATITGDRQLFFGTFPTLQISQGETDTIIIEWSPTTLQNGQLILQQATQIEGPWTDVEDATSPYTVSVESGNLFFRLEGMEE